MRLRRHERSFSSAREAARNGLLDRTRPRRTGLCPEAPGVPWDKGVGGPNDRLVGGRGTLASQTPVRTIGSYWPYATTVFDYVRRSMPFFQPHSLTNSEVYAVTAHLLNLNGIIAEQDVMSAETLPKVRMPNQDNFIPVQPWKPRVP
jgi:hypothetical protein